MGDFENPTLVLFHLYDEIGNELREELHELSDSIVDITIDSIGGYISLYGLERGGGRIPSSRFSDGTLRFLSLLAVLLHPTPPPFVALEEPELGLHPDAVGGKAELLVNASKRMQIVATTHSPMLIDALTEVAGSVVVCEKEDGETRMERLNAGQFQSQLGDCNLAELWSSGQIRGNRW